MKETIIEKMVGKNLKRITISLRNNKSFTFYKIKNIEIHNETFLCISHIYVYNPEKTINHFLVEIKEILWISVLEDIKDIKIKKKGFWTIFFNQ